MRLRTAIVAMVWTYVRRPRSFLSQVFISSNSLSLSTITILCFFAISKVIFVSSDTEFSFSFVFFIAGV